MSIDRMESRTHQRRELWTRSVGLLSNQRHELFRLIRLNIDKEKRRGIRRSILLYLTEQRLFHQRHRDNHHHADADGDHDSRRLASRPHDITQGIAKAQDARHRHPGQPSHERRAQRKRTVMARDNAPRNRKPIDHEPACHTESAQSPRMIPPAVPTFHRSASPHPHPPS